MPSDTKGHPPLLKRLGRLRPYFGTLPGTWCLVALGAIVGSDTEPMIPKLLQLLLDLGFKKDGGLALWMVPVALIGLFGIRGLAGYVSQIGLARITGKGLNDLRSAMFDKLLVAKLDLYSEQSSSSLSNTLVYEVQSGSAMLVNAMLTLTRNALTTVALTIYLFYQNWQLTLIVACIFPAVALVMRVLSRRLHNLTKTNQTVTDELAYVVEENVLAHREVRLYNAQKLQSARFQALSKSLERLAMKSTVAGAAMTPMTQLLAAAALSAVVSVALLQSANSNTSVGEFAAFVTAMLMIVAPIRQLSEVATPITRGLAALERALDLIDTTSVEEQGTFEVPRAQGNIRLENVTVCYSGDESNAALADFSLTVQAGQTVALVGASGSGKTTLVNLLPRFVNASKGQIYLDDHALAEWNLTALRNQFAFVSQNVVMINDTVSANVALGMPMDATRVVQCLDAAHLSSWLAGLPQGIETKVGHNATQLSGGQRQRLAIARALYKDAPILILDEATSALDTESERVVQDALGRLMQNRTTIIVAHRLSTVQHADQVVVMQSGRVIEMGSPKDLMELDGAYARLYRMGLHPESSLQSDDAKLP